MFVSHDVQFEEIFDISEHVLQDEWHSKKIFGCYIRLKLFFELLKHHPSIKTSPSAQLFEQFEFVSNFVLLHLAHIAFESV